jgi:hypothetical protein
MGEISSVGISENFSTYRDQYARLRRRDRIVGATEDLPEWLALQISKTEMDPRFNCLDDG